MKRTASIAKDAVRKLTTSYMVDHHHGYLLFCQQTFWSHEKFAQRCKLLILLNEITCSEFRLFHKLGVCYVFDTCKSDF